MLDDFKVPFLDNLLWQIKVKEYKNKLYNVVNIYVQYFFVNNYCNLFFNMLLGFLTKSF